MDANSELLKSLKKFSKEKLNISDIFIETIEGKLVMKFKYIDYVTSIIDKSNNGEIVTKEELEIMQFIEDLMKKQRI